MAVGPGADRRGTRVRPPRGPGGGARTALGHRRRWARGKLYNALTEYTKPQQTIQNPDRLYKDPICIRMHLFASVCNPMHPSALFTPPDADLQEIFSRNK